MHDIANYWAGTESSYLSYIADLKTVATIEPQTSTTSGTPRLLSKQGDIAIINVHGRLTNTEAWYSELMGDSTYPAIREALVHAAQDPSVKAIALDIKSGGGMVSGVQDTADLVSRIDTSVKPVYSYSDGTIASAAYWLGCSARSLEIGATTDIGSLGVLAVHQENSRMMEDAGVKTTIIRSGRFKALGHSAEPLSDEGKQVIQAQVDQLNTMFVEHVAQARKTTTTLVEQNMGQGRMFIGKAGVDVGLADGISSFDAFMSKITQGIAKSQKSDHSSQNYYKGTPLKHALTDQDIAAMASGAVTAPVAPAATPPAADPAPTPAAATPTQTPITATLEVQVADAAVVSLLQTQLATAQAQVVALSVDLQTAKAAVDTQHKQADSMRPIVRAAVGNLRVALGGTAAGVEAMTDDLLLAEHANLAAQFQAKFKAGGVAAVSSSADKESQVVALDPLRQARLAATRIGK